MGRALTASEPTVAAAVKAGDVLSIHSHLRRRPVLVVREHRDRPAATWRRTRPWGRTVRATSIGAVNWSSPLPENRPPRRDRRRLSRPGKRQGGRGHHATVRIRTSNSAPATSAPLQQRHQLPIVARASLTFVIPTTHPQWHLDHDLPRAVHPQTGIATRWPTGSATAGSSSTPASSASPPGASPANRISWKTPTTSRRAPTPILPHPPVHARRLPRAVQYGNRTRRRTYGTR